MPLNTTTDKNVNEIAVETGNNSVLIQYADYHYFTSITGSALPNYNTTPYNNIPIGLAPSYCMPETISVLGHWQSSDANVDKAGFVIKMFVVKTVLNTTALLNQYLGYVPDSGYTVAMYDFLAQVTLQSGFGAISNKIFLISVHRGFSRHSRNGTWFGDGNTAGRVVGVFDVNLTFGFNYNFQPVRTDNIYSDSKFVTIDALSDPPTKYLDIYESITGPIVSSFKINNNTNRPAVANFVTTSLVGERNFTGSVSFSYSTSNKIDRATYTLGVYAKTIGEDKRVYAPAVTGRAAGWHYSLSATNLYRNNGRLFDGKFETTNAAFILQNRSGLQCGEVKVTTLGNSNSVVIFGSDRASYPAGQSGTASIIRSRFYINGAFSSGYSILSHFDEINGAQLCFPKRVSFNSYLMNYNNEHDYLTDNVYFRMNMPVSKAQTSIGVDHCPVKFGPFVANVTIPNTFGTSSIHRFTNFNSKATVAHKTRTLSSISSNFSISNFAFDDTLQRNYIGKKLISLNLNARSSGFSNGAYLNTRDNQEDGKVFIRGEMLPAYVHKKAATLDLKNITFVDQSSSKPGDSLDFVRLNNYRWITVRTPLAPGGNLGPFNFRITIWEAGANSIVEKYWDVFTTNVAPITGSDTTIDLIYPDYPGALLDTQDDPYPRVTTELSLSERKNDAYYGLGRIVRIDISSLNQVHPTNYSIYANILGQEVLNFVASYGSDSNLKLLDVKNNANNEYGRRFLLIRQENKPEEETDIVYDNNTKTIRNLTVGEFVQRLNNLHGGMQAYAINPSVPAYLMQGLHFNYSVDKVILKRFDQTNKQIDHRTQFYTEKNATIYYSELYQGLYLDFPPFMQDVFKFESDDLWITSNKRRPSSSQIDIDLRIYCNLRGHVYGSQALGPNNKPTAKTEVFVYQDTPLPVVQKGATNTVLNSYANGFYSTGRPFVFKNYDYGITRFNKVRLGAVTSTNINNIKMLPSKISRISYGQITPYKINPYAPPVANTANYISVAEGKLKNEFTAVLSPSLYSLSPYVNAALTPAQKQIRSSARIVNFNPSGNEIFNLKVLSTNADPIIPYNIQSLNQNRSGNSRMYLLGETYIFPNTQSLVYVNKEFNDEDHWIFYDDAIYRMANIFKLTDNNSYATTLTSNYIYTAGTYQNYLILQSAAYDNIQSIGSVANYGANPADARYSLYIDGYNAAVNLQTIFPTISSFTQSTTAGIVSKSPALIAVREDELFVFYVKQNPLNTLYYAYINYENVQATKILFTTSNFTTSLNVAISNVNAIYDKNLGKIRIIFQTSTTGNNTNINIFYTEVDVRSGDLPTPSEFHHVAGIYNQAEYLPNVFFGVPVSSSKTIIFQKAGLFQYSNSDQRGLLGVIYVDNKGALYRTTFVPFLLANETQEIK